MNMEDIITEKVKRFEDIKNQITALQQKIGALTEQQRALYNQGLELKGGIESLFQIKEAEAAKLATSKTAQLILPEGTKPIIPEAQPTIPEATMDAAAPTEVVS